jgi:peptide/nickel transport system permease protein
MTSTALSDADEIEGLSDKPKSFGRLAFERFVRHKLALVGSVRTRLIAARVHRRSVDLRVPVRRDRRADRMLGPSADHWFGTDEIGRDLFTRTARGGRYSLVIGLLAAVLATVFGTLMGAIAGYFGKAVDAVISQMINLILVVPFLLTLALFALKFGSTWWRLALVLAHSSGPASPASCAASCCR